MASTGFNTLMQCQTAICVWSESPVPTVHYTIKYCSHHLAITSITKLGKWLLDNAARNRKYLRALFAVCSLFLQRNVISFVWSYWPSMPSLIMLGFSIKCRSTKLVHSFCGEYLHGLLHLQNHKNILPWRFALYSLFYSHCDYCPESVHWNVQDSM